MLSISSLAMAAKWPPHLALYVFAAGAAQHFTQSAFVDRYGDALAGARHHFYQQAQLGGDAAMLALLFNKVLGEADTLHGTGLYLANNKMMDTK
jgi:hypothetical protein